MRSGRDENKQLAVGSGPPAVDSANCRILILGYGNPLRGDDALGVVAVQRLAGVMVDPAVRVMTAHQLLPEHAEPISRAELVIFIDICCDRPAGEVVLEEVAPAAAVSRSVTHHFDPPALLAFGRRVFGGDPKAYVVAVGGECFGCVEGLSPAVQAALPGVIDRVRELVNRWLKGMGHPVGPCSSSAQEPSHA
jgi:hydrogenase maturation protease